MPKQCAHASVCCFLIEHLEKPEKLFEVIHHLLRPGALAFLTGALTAAQIDHIYEFRRESELVRMAEASGLRVIETLSANPKRLLPKARFVPRSMALLLQKGMAPLVDEGQDRLVEDGKLFKEFRRLRKQGRLDQAAASLRQGLRRGQLAPADTIQAGRLLLKHLPNLDAEPSPRIQILGQFSTSWLTTALAAVSAGRGVTALVSDGNYDNVLQDSLDLTRTFDVVVLVPWHHRLFAGTDRSLDRRVEDELVFWKQVWNQVAERSRLLQVGYDWVHPGGMGHFLGAAGDGHVNLVRLINLQLRQHLPEGAFFVDLEQVSGGMGREAFYDPRNYFWSKHPLSERGTVRLAEHIWAGVRAVLSGPKKVLVTDLDNTLWGGVVGEVGPLGD